MEENCLEGNIASRLDNEDPESTNLLRTLGILFSPTARQGPNRPEVTPLEDDPIIDDAEVPFKNYSPFDSPGEQPPLSENRELLDESVHLNYEHFFGNFVKSDKLSKKVEFSKKDRFMLHKHSLIDEKEAMSPTHNFNFQKFIHAHILTSPCSRFTLKSSQLENNRIESNNMNLFHNDGFDNEGYRKVKEFHGFDLLSFIPETAVIAGIEIKEQDSAGEGGTISSSPSPTNPSSTKREVYTIFYDIKSNKGYKSPDATMIDINFLLRDTHDSAFNCYVAKPCERRLGGNAAHSDHSDGANLPPTLSSVFGVASGSSECKENKLKDWSGTLLEFASNDKKHDIFDNKDPVIKIYPLKFKLPEQKFKDFAEDSPLSFTLFALGTKLAVIGRSSLDRKLLLTVYQVKLQKEADIYTISLTEGKSAQYPDFERFHNDHHHVNKFKSLYDPLRTSSHSISHLPLTDSGRKITVHMDVDHHLCRLVFQSTSRTCISSIKYNPVSRRREVKHNHSEEVQNMDHKHQKNHKNLHAGSRPQDDWADCFLEVVKEDKNKAIKIWLKNSPSVDKENTPHYTDVFNFAHPHPETILLLHVTPDLRHIWIIEKGANEDSALKPINLNLVNKPLFNLFTPAKALKRNSQILSNGTFEVRMDNQEIQVRNFKPADGEVPVIKQKHSKVFRFESLKRKFKCFSANADFSKLYVLFLNEEMSNVNQLEVFEIPDFPKLLIPEETPVKKMVLDLEKNDKFIVEMREEFIFILRNHNQIAASKIEPAEITDRKEDMDAGSGKGEEDRREIKSASKTPSWTLQIMTVHSMEFAKLGQENDADNERSPFILQTGETPGYLTLRKNDQPLNNEVISMQYEFQENDRSTLSDFLVKYTTVVMNKLVIGPFQPQPHTGDLPATLHQAILLLDFPQNKNCKKRVKARWLENYCEEDQFDLACFSRPSPYAMKEEVDHTKVLLYSEAGFKVVNLGDTEAITHSDQDLKSANTDCKRILKLNSIPRLSASGKQVVYADSENKVRLSDFAKDDSFDNLKPLYSDVESKIEKWKADSKVDLSPEHDFSKQMEHQKKLAQRHKEEEEIMKAKDRLKNQFFNGKEDRILTQVPPKEVIIDLYMMGSGQAVTQTKDQNCLVFLLKWLSNAASKISAQISKLLSIVTLDKRKLVILSFCDDMLHVRVFCFEKRSIIYNFVAESPYDLDKYFGLQREQLCCYHINNDLNQHKKEISSSNEVPENTIEVSIYDSREHSKFTIFFEFGRHSKYYSGHFLQLLTDEFIHDEGSKVEQDRLIRGVKAWLNLISPSKHCEIAPLAENCLKLRCPSVMQEFLNNTQEDMAYTHCDLFDLYDFKKRKGETNDGISFRCIWDSVRCWGKKDKFKPTLQNDQFKKDLYEMFKKKSESSIESSVLNERKATKNFLHRNIGDEMQDEIYQELFKLQLMTKTNEFIKCNLPDPLLRTFGSDFSRGVGHAIDQLRGQLEEEAAENYTTYEVYRSLVQVDLSVRSEAVVNMLYTMERMADKDLEGPLLPIVYFIWNKIQWAGILVAIMYWVYTGAAYSFFVYYPSSGKSATFFFVLSAYFTFLESWSIKAQGLRYYLQSPWNWIDMILLLFSNFTAIILSIALVNDHNTSTMPLVWCRVISLILIYVRALSFLRISIRIRYLITMVLEVFVDMIPFLILLAGVVILVSFVWHLSPLLTYDGIEQNPDLYTSTYQIIMILCGNSPSSEDDQSNFTIFRLCLICIANLVLSLCFLNFLIAVISGTYSRINDRKNLYDVKALITLLIEVISYIRVPFWVGNTRYYILTLHPVEEMNEGIAAINSNGEAILERIETAEVNIQRVLSHLTGKDPEDCKWDLKDAIDKLDRNSKSIENRIAYLEDNIKKNEEKKKKELSQLNEKMEDRFTMFETMLSSMLSFVSEEKERQKLRQKERELERQEIMNALRATKTLEITEGGEREPKVIDPLEVAVALQEEQNAQPQPKEKPKGILGGLFG